MKVLSKVGPGFAGVSKSFCRKVKFPVLLVKSELVADAKKFSYYEIVKVNRNRDGTTPWTGVTKPEKYGMPNRESKL